MAYMDENGDAEGNYTVLGRLPHHKVPGEFGLYPVGIFTRTGNRFSLPVRRQHLDKLFNDDFLLSTSEGT